MTSQSLGKKVLFYKLVYNGAYLYCSYRKGIEKEYAVAPYLKIGIANGPMCFGCFREW